MWQELLSNNKIIIKLMSVEIKFFIENKNLNKKTYQNLDEIHKFFHFKKNNDN